MSREKTTTENTRKVEQTAAEKAINESEARITQAAEPGRLAVQQGGFDFATDLFSGLNTGSANSNLINQLLAGISPELTQEISQNAVQDILPSFQSSGILDSGVAASIAGQVAGDTRRNVAQFNLGNLFNLANLAGGQGAQVQSTAIGQSGNLGNRLAGLRTITGNQTVTSPNPFLQSLQRSAGSSIGGLAGDAVSGGFGGFGK